MIFKLLLFYTKIYWTCALIAEVWESEKHKIQSIESFTPQINEGQSSRVWRWQQWPYYGWATWYRAICSPRLQRAGSEVEQKIQKLATVWDAGTAGRILACYVMLLVLIWTTVNKYSTIYTQRQFVIKLYIYVCV